MPLFKISEYTNLADDERDRVIPAVKEPPVTPTQVLDFTAGIQTSAVFHERTKFVRIYTDTACDFLFGVDPTAVSGASCGMAAGQTEIFGVTKGLRVSVIA